MYITRLASTKIEKLLETFPATAILGARQVGKTTLAKMLSTAYPSIYLDFELPQDLNKLSEPALFLKNFEDQLVILDEVQIKENIFPVLRALIDQKRMPTRYLILGSVSPSLLQQSAESLAGRIAYVDLQPLNLIECMNENLHKLWLRGGFPLSYLSSSDSDSIEWRRQFIRSYIERDLTKLGLPNNPLFLRRFWTMTAHVNGTTINYAHLSRSLQKSNPTIKTYFELFCHALLMYEIQPYFRNIRKRLVKSPKYYFSDTGLLHGLLDIESFEDLLGNPYSGNSWETFVINQVRSILPNSYRLSFYKTHQGAEIDMLILKNEIPFWACEIKLSNAPKVSKGFYWAFDDLEAKSGYIITPNSETYPISENIHVIGLYSFLEKIMNL